MKNRLAWAESESWKAKEEAQKARTEAAEFKRVLNMDRKRTREFESVVTRITPLERSVKIIRAAELMNAGRGHEELIRWELEDESDGEGRELSGFEITGEKLKTMTIWRTKNRQDAHRRSN